MKNTRDNRQTQVKNCLKWTASGLLLALLFVLVFAGTLSGAFGIENELQQNGIIQSNVASAAYDTNPQYRPGSAITVATATTNSYTSTTSNINLTTSGVEIAAKYNVSSNPNDNQLLSNFYQSYGSPANNISWVSYNWLGTKEEGFGINSSGTEDDAYVYWLEFKFDEKIIAAIRNVGVSFYASATGRFDNGKNDEYAFAISYIGEHAAPTYAIVNGEDGARKGDGASWSGSFTNAAAKSEWTNDDKKTFTLGNNGYSNGYKLTNNTTGIRLIFAAIADGELQGGFRNISCKLFLGNEKMPITVSPSNAGTVSNTELSGFSNIEDTKTVSFKSANDPYYFSNWSYKDQSGIINTNSNASLTVKPYYSDVTAQYKEIPFVFNGTSYATYNPIIKLVVLENTENYMSSTIDGYNTSIEYKKNGVKIPQPKDIGKYTATITVKKDGVVRGTRTVEFEVVEGDFGKIQGGTGKWGSATNPYVISNETHLKNLSAIVNGRDALNSIVGSNNNSVTAEDVVATDKTYKDCYFVVAADLGTADAQIALVPIGKNGTYYFAGTIFGGNDSDATNRTMRTINLNIQQRGESNVGLFGYVKGEGASISYIKTAGTIVGGNATGGLVGCMENGEIFNCANSATVTGREQVGGIVGYNPDNQRGKIYGTIINDGAINGTNMVGGLVGQWHGEWNLNGTYGTFTNTGDVNGGTGASVGGIAGFADRTIKNAANSGNVVGGTSVGGIAGRCQAPIENSYNTGDVRGTATTSQGEITGSPTGVFVGGITGYTSANASISNCYNTGHISALSTSGGYLSNANYVGGIVGFAQAAVSYCANIGGLIEGNDYLGGIVGNSSSTIYHCYDVQGQRKHRYDTGRIGAISGYGGTATNSWAINAKANDGSTCSNPNPTISNVGKVFVSVGDVAPAVIDGYTEKVWTDILTININGFKATATVNNGKFLASATASNGATSVVPAKIDGALTANANGASAQQTTDATLTYWYNANTSSNIYVQIKNINGAANVKTYNGANQTIDNVSASPFTATAFYFDANYAGTATDGKMNAGTYSVIVDVVVDGNVVGRKLFGSWTINTRIISQNSSSATYYYGARILSPDIADILSNIVNGHSVTSDKTLYNFYDAIPASGSRTYTITYTNIRIVANGSDVTGNYKINNSYTFTITVNEGDFGVYGTTDIEKNPWGSVNNPYVIRTQAQLERLSAIVASGSAVNSIYNSTNYPYAKATDKSFANAYFVLDGNISMTYTSSFSYSNISSSPAGNSGETADKLFDNNTSSKLCVSNNAKTVTIYVSTNVPIIVNSYSWWTGNDTSGNTGRNPNYFKIEGSTDGSNWYVIDERSGSWTTANNTQVNVTGMNGAGRAGRYNRFRITSTCSGGTWQASEFRFNYATSEQSVPIGNSSTKFSGTFDGKNHTISNFKTDPYANGAGLFGYVKGGTVKNVNMSGTTINNEGSIYHGMIAGVLEGGTITDCTAQGWVWGSEYVGGIVGRVSGASTISNCTVLGNSQINWNGSSGASQTRTGGIVGGVDGDGSFVVTVENCTNNAKVVNNNDGTYGFGGIVGYNSGKTVNLTSCTNKGEINGKSETGGIIGYTDNSTITDCTNNGKIGGVDNVGGIVGKICAGSVENCINTGAVSATSQAGGIIGNTNGVTVKNCKNEAGGTVTATGNAAVGGIVGGLNDGGTLVIEKCENNAAINASNANGVAGIVGHNPSSAVSITVTSCKNTGVITGSLNVGGIGGRIETTQNERLKLVFRNCYNSAAIYAKRASQYGTVGGIIGYLYANGTTRSDVAVIEYCFSSGYVESTSGINEGGIVGNATSSTRLSVRVSYCYTTNTAHSIAGYSGATISSSYVIMNSDSSTPDTKNDARFFVYNGNKTSYAPAVIVKNGDSITSCTKYAWEDILTTNINGFMVQATVNPGASQYYHTANGTSSTVYIKPDRIENNHIANAENRNDATSFELTAWYASERNGNYYCDVKEIAISNKSTTYNGGNQGFDFGDVTPKNGSVYSISFDYVYNYNGRIETVPNEVGTYDTTVFVKIDGIVVGKKMGAKYTVDKAALNVGWEWTDKLHANLYDRTGNGDKVQFVYNGKAQGLDSVSEHLRDVQLFDVTGNALTNTNAATYTRTYTLKDTRNYKLQNANNNNADLSGTTVTFEWKIRKNKLTVSNYWTGADLNPSGEFYTFEYNATHQGLKLQDGITFYVEPDTRGNQHVIDTIAYEIAQGVECVAADTYTRTFTIKDTTNYEVGNRLSYNTSVLPNQKGSDVNTEKSVVTYTWKIVPYSLATNIISGNVWFGGRKDLIVGNQGIANVKVGNTNEDYYPLQADKKGAPGVRQVLVYAQHNYTADKFVLYVKYNNGTVAVLTQGTEYTVGTLDTNNTFGTFVNVVSQADPVVDTNVTARGTGNFSGDITKWYTALHSDFGGNMTGANWGSQDNPYVISTPEHLLRLSQIVNGGKAWNSINTTDLCISPQTTAKATSRDYKDAYFRVTADIDMSGYISTDGVYNFLPIGTRSTQNQTELPFSATLDGGDKMITYVYNVGSFYNVDGARTNYVGLFGYLNGATISNLKVASNGGLSITDNDGIVGIEYVGGIAGCAVDSTLYNTVLAYGGWVRGENYVGGIVGYGERITIVSSEAVSSANVGGETYVGGIVGKWIVSNQSQIGGSVAGQRYVTPADQTDVMGIKYVGGIAGWMDTSSCATTISYAPQLNNNGKEQNLIVVGGIEYVGALFGAFIGNGYHQNATNDKYTAIVIDKDASDKFKVGNVKVLLQKLNEKSASGNAKVVGGLVGYAEGVGILFNTDWTTSNVTLDTGNYTPSFIGGIAGVLGKNATIEAIYQLKDDGTFLTGGTHTITHSVPDKQKTFGTAAKPLGSFVGGIVGYVSSQAGVYWETGTTIFGNGISLVNSATIYATSYAGGIFGALGDIPASVAKDFESDSILYKVLTTGVREGSASTTLGLAPTVDSNGITAKGRLVNNASISVSGSYVGGIAGYGGAKVRFVLRNTPQDSAIDVSKLNIYSGGSDIFINGSYAGGIAGYLVDNLEHDLQYIVVKARFNTNNQNATRVGGLVGYMGSGNVQNCVVTNGGSSAITASTDTYQGSEYVGGLVGETQNATIRNSVSTGFNLEKTSNTKGGLLGYGANPTIDSSWTFYIAKKRTNFAKNATPNGAYYATVSQSPYGKYILVDEGLINATESSYPTFASLCGFVGLLTNANVEGTLEFDVKVPNKTLDSNYENTQLAFYNASGSDTVTDNVDSFSKFENKNNTLTIALDMASGNSMQICVVGIEFANVPQKNDTDTDKTTVVEGTYRKPSNSDKYIVHVTTANFNSERQITKIVATVYFECNDNLSVVIGSAYDDKRNIGGYDETFTPGSSTNPYTISSQKEWNDFAYSIYSGAKDYAGEYVKLLTNITINNTTSHMGTASSSTPLNFSTECTPNNNSDDNKNAKSNLGYNLAGNISQGSSAVNRIYFGTSTTLSTTTPSFKGTFDGNGNTIDIQYTSGGYHRISVFPNAANATFKNLTINGTIAAGTNTSNSGYDIAAFVGKPFGAITFTNCTAAVDIQGLRVIAGFSGYSSSTSPITLIGCVNKGDITSFEGSKWNKSTGQNLGYPDDYQYGTGGLIAYATNDITIDSCLNTGNIVGQTKVGGLVGRVTAFTTIKNSANTGDITGEEVNPYISNDDKKQAGNAWSRVGGLVGEASKTATLKMYACYNTGAIRGKSNVAGGLVGILGTIPSKEKPHSTEANNTSTIAYCYNTGEVTIGWKKFGGITMVGLSGYNFNGTDAGGLVGVAVKLNIEYSYNTGDIHGYGGVGNLFTWQVRNGGILAEACTKASNCSISINNCYSTGRIYIEENETNSDTRYSADIVGYLDEEGGDSNDGNSKVRVANCYGIANNIVSRKDSAVVYYSGWNSRSGNVQYVRTGTTLNSLSDLTAIMRSDGSVKPRAFYYANNQNNEVELWNASTSTIGAQNDENYKNGTLGGYVYVYGCLPQLAVFAVDTYNGLSMNSQNFGKDIYGEYKTQKAGEEYSPYVIRDGIDLMGVQTLVNLGYTFENEYIEFANGKNNITLDKNLSSDVAKAINMPISNSTSTKIADSENAYKSLGKDNTYHIGKSYHLFKLSAVCYDDNNIAQNTAYGYWLSSNHYYNGAYGNKKGAYKNCGTFKTQNILTIGRNGNLFKGSISGKQYGDEDTIKNTVINNLRITSGQTTGGAYAGLFGHVENATISYIEIGGSSNIWAYSSDNQQIAATGGIVGYATGSTTIEHCAVSGTTAIGAYGKDDNTQITSDKITFAGGIVGLVDTKQGNTYNTGISITIKDCYVDISTTTDDRKEFAGMIVATKSNIGGILGYIEGDDGASGKSNTVRIEGCSVDKAVIQAASSANTSSQIGGILGYGSQYVAAFITDCEVGVGGTVSIKGEHSLGGIAGGMSNAKGGYIDSCTVGAYTTIERIAVGGNGVEESPKHGTAIGGLVGFTQDSKDDTSPLTTTFSGTSAFNGTITVSVEATNSSSDSDGKISCIGGIVGDMGSGANFASGSNVTVGGNINITLAAANVGGVVGRTNKATFIGKFNVAPNMSTENAENVGGFIGKNIGTVYILADTTDKLENTTIGALNGTSISIGGKIKGTSEVGGFIGVNDSGSTLNIGSNVANAKPYKSGTLTITITASVTGSGDNVGGIVGKNEGDDENTQDNDYATIDIVKGTIEQNGAIIGANNVGGIIGLNDGLLTTGGGEADTSIGGTTLSEEQQNKIKNLSINNTGSVTGTGDYVGGVVGKLDSPSALRTEDSGKGAIAGTFTNSGNVSGGKFVGGSLGYVGKNVTITAKNNVATLFVNDGQVTATGYYAGGSIGVLVGKIEGVDNGHTVNFKNTGTVTATGFVGGSIGVLAGPVKYAQFVNSSGNLSIAAVNAVGGSVGFIGVPTPLETILTGVGITLADDYVKVENTHFEASGELTANPDSNAISVAKDAATNKSTGWGGVGGAIGVIGKNVRWGTEQNKNTYYANGNVTANGINNVGGIVGIILAENVNISNMLAYNTTVKGGENVGGIVGATDGIGTVITSAYAIEGTFTGSKNVGGIIGLAKPDTDASTSYWVKGYTNAILAGTDVKNLQQDLGKFETIIEYVEEQPIVFTEEFCKMYTPKTYYDDYPGVHTYNGNTVTAVTDVNLTWETYIRTNLGETDAQIKNGAWVKPIANAPTYTTGANNTGWYFVYATDKTIGTINAEHSTNANLQYWKRIADAYTSSERNEGKDDNVKNPLASDIVLGNGAPQKSTLYATATAAGTESGYYLYMATSGKSRPSATNQDNKFYIQTLTTNADALAENVAVYYRTISKGKALTFNGYLRYAPVGITASEGETVSYIKNPETATGKPNSYCYSADTTTAGGQGTGGAQTNPGSFHSQVNIYYFDSEGKPHVVGGVAIGWTINKRELTAEFTANNDRTYGEDRKQEGDGTVKHDMKLVVGNIAPEAGKNAGIVITISSDNESYTFTWDGTRSRFDKTSAGGIVISAEGMTDPGATNGWDASDSLYNVDNPADKQTKDFSCFIDFTNAKTYTISVTTTATSGAQYTLDKTTNFSVKQATLTLKGVPTTNNPDSVIFDNKTHAFSWKVEGFKYNDDISQLALFSPTAYALGKSAPLFNSGTPNTMKTGSVTIDGVENVTYTIYSNSNSIDISGARDKGEYYIGFATLSAGNYKLKLDKGVESLKQSIKLSISDNELTFDWRGAGGSHPYDKKTKGTITLTITAKSAIDGFENFVKKFFAPTMSGTGANAVWGTASDNKSITITFTTGVNAGTYTATIAQNKNETAFIEANKVNCSYPMIPQSRSYKIDKRNLTITLISKDNKTSYTYNGQHQGLVSIRVNSASGSTGLISGDSVNATVSVSREGTEFGSISVSAITSSTANNVRLSTINFGKYIATVTMAENTNYTCQQSGTLEWKIEKYQLTLSDLTGGQKVYDGIATKPTLKVNGVSVDNGEFTPSGVSGDRIAIKYSASIDGQSYESIVNAGKYSVSIGGNGANAITVSPATRDGINTADNYSIEGGQSVDYVILPRTLKLSWQEIQSFVFSNTEQGLIVIGVEGVEDGGNGSLAVKSGTSTINGVKLTGYAGGDTIEITIIGALLHANSTSKMEAKITSVSGTNKDGSNSIEGNYTLSEDDRFSGEFTITPSVVSIKFNASNATLTKVYDGNRTVPSSQINDSYFSWSATGHNPTSNPFKVTAQYDNKNVGDKKAVTFSYTFIDPSNRGDYTIGNTDGSAYTVGQITPAHIKVALDKLRSGKATRTFTNKPYYGGENGASGGKNDGKSTVYRSGEGFRISGVLGTDKIKVVAQYREADDSRNGTDNSFDLSSYVNDVVKNADGTFDKAENAGTHLKMLVFTMTGDDAKNYTFNVYNKLGTDGKKYSEKDSTAGDKQTVTVYDTDDKANEHQNANGAEQIQIEITVKSVRVDYGNAYQSYAKADNTYNTNWEPITATSKDITAADGTIDVVNNWMYEDNDPTKPKREYHGYTTIRGSEKSTVLGATISKDKGMNFNFRLINQPVLTIAYIVENNGTYEIDTLARLLIASFYYTAHQNPGDQIFMQIVQSGYKWFEVVKGEDYSQVEFAPDLKNSPITVDDTIKTWDAYINALNEAGYAVFYNETEKAWGCYVSDSSQPTALPNSYKLTKDISGKFTSDDIKVLDAFFTVTTADENGQFTTKKYTWSGTNSDYLKNVLSAAVDKVATINGSLFVSQKAEGVTSPTGFDGTFDGNGYVIEYLNIMGYSKENVGLFDIIGANGSVKNLHLRNITINANQGNVGGIAGSIAAVAGDADAAKNVTNVSFHGKITATGGTVGGLFGTSARAIDGAIVLGEISATNANVGGVAGTLTASLTNVVSMMQITANGGTVGAFTSNNANVGEDCKHMTNAVWQRGTGFVNVVGKNVDYNALMLGSNSLYANGTSVLGTYDVIDETFADSGQNANPRQSKRLRDMVSVYLLMYSLSVNNGKYTISSSSWLVGTADGTTAKPIAIANKQNVSLLRELRFASFTLKANVSIEIASTFSGAFYGSVTSATNESGTSYGYKITCDKAMFEAYSNNASAWLSVQQS